MKITMVAMIVSFLLLQAAITSQGEGTFFTSQPENKRVRYGEIVEFRCQVRNYTNYGLEMFVGDNVKIFPIHELNALGKNFTGSLHPGEFSAEIEQADNCTAMSCEGIGIFWMVANSRTLPLVDYFWCRATHNGRHEDSNQAFIVDVFYPECGDNNISTETSVYYDKINTTNNGVQNLIFTWLCLLFFSVCLFVWM